MTQTWLNGIPSYKLNVLYQQRTLEEKGYEQMAIELFQKWVGTIGDKGWALFCLLSIYYIDNFGYAYPSQKTMVSALKIGRTTLTKTTLWLSNLSSTETEDFFQIKAAWQGFPTPQHYAKFLAKCFGVFLYDLES